MHNQLGLLAAALAAVALSCSEPAEQDERPRVEADGTVHVPAFDLSSSNTMPRTTAATSAPAPCPPG